MSISEKLVIDFEHYLNSPLRQVVTYFGTYGLTINISDAVKESTPSWFNQLVTFIMSLPYMETASAIGVVLLIVERYYAIRVRRAELKRIEREAK